MKTTEVKTVIIESAELTPLIDRALKAVEGKRVVNIQFFSDMREGRPIAYPELDEKKPECSIQLSVLVEKRLE